MMPMTFDNKHRRRRPWLTAGVVLLTAAVAMAETGWKEEKVTDDGITVYSRSQPNTTVREVLVKMTISAPPKLVFESFMDPKTFKDTTDKYVEKNLFFREADPNIWYNYQLVNYPVIAKRDYCLKYEKSSTPQTGFYKITWRASDRFGPPPQEDVVRVSNLHGSLEVTSDGAPNRSKIVYTLLADPGGNIPTWLINLANRRSLPDILRQVKEASLKRAKSGK